MKNSDIQKQIAIVGCGPRGLASLEALFKFQSEKSNTTNFEVSIFEPAKNPGAGLIWNLQQSDSNWMNISDRALKNLQGRSKIEFRNFSITSFPSFSEWSKGLQNFENKPSAEVDKFLPRSTMGHYLSERYNSIADVLIQQKILTFFDRRICKVYSKKGAVMLIDNKGDDYNFDECVLSIGHQPTHASKQISEWKAASETFNISIITNPYDERFYTDIGTGKTIAIRGFGLATIDIIRLLTVERGDRFELVSSKSYEFQYVTSEHSIQQIIPFSLDGLPPMPKPIGEQVDRLFKPNQNQTQIFTQTIKEHLSGNNDLTSKEFLIKAFSAIASDIFLNLGDNRIEFKITTSDLANLIENWLDNMDARHPLILDTELNVEVYMEKAVQMAFNLEPISLDYCVGQVWRHIQPAIYKELSHSNLPDSVIADIIALDESTKRYSYGPPVESVAQLIALSKAGKLNLNFLNNPKIEIDGKGWNIKSKGKSTTATTMIDSVLDAPKLKQINSEIIEYLLKDDLLSPVTSDLGVKTRKDGIVVLAKAHENINLSMLGRNSKGSVVGVDAILECFGPRIDDWARGIVNRVNRS